MSNAFYSQNKRVIDSLLISLQKAKVDTVKAGILNDLSWEYNQGDSKKAMYYANELLKFSQDIKYNWGIGAAYGNIAFCYEYDGNYPEALKYRIMNLEITERYGTKRNISKSYNNIAILYNNIGEYDKALEYYFKKVRIVQKIKQINLKKALGTTYNNIGVTYNSKKMYDSALKYIFIAKEYAYEVRDSALLVDALTNLGITYDEIGAHKQEALRSFTDAIAIANKINYQRSYSLLYVSLANLYANMANYGQAILYAQRSIDYSFITGQRSARMSGYQVCIIVYDKMKEYDKKSTFQEKYMLLKDSLINEEKNKQIGSLRISFETEEKEKENTILSSQVQIQDLQISRSRYLIFGMTVLFIAGILLVFVIIRQNRLKAEQKSIQLEQKLLRSQMNPHFIFNSLIAIESFIYSNEPRVAGRYLSDFAKLMRLILENSREEYVSLEKEVKTLELYLSLQKLRFEEKFEYKINLSQELDIENTLIPPMLAQPFIENAIEHGIKNMASMGLIEISFSRRVDEIVFELIDNGIGMEKSSIMKRDKEAHRSMATLITRERLSLLNKGRISKINFTMEDLKDNAEKPSGTRVYFGIPLKEA